MDTLIIQVLQAHLVGGIKVSHVLVMLAGSLIPVLFGIILPRKRSIQYGMAINKFLGLALLQKRCFKTPLPNNILQAIICSVQTTFQDVSFGVYLDSRKDLSKEDRENKIIEYLEPPKG
ncbi:MAG: hypothetical protein IMZ64_12430 [Bacteroidetes bacterium]|nr:hypothetical protein [Bacteroidota bacterium]